MCIGSTQHESKGNFRYTVPHNSGISPGVSVNGKSQSKTSVKLEKTFKIVLMEHGTKRNSQGLFVPSMNEVYPDDEDQHSSTPEEHKGAKNAYFEYRSDPAVKARFSQSSARQGQSKIVQMMSIEWNKLSAAQKLPYQEKAERAARMHKKASQRLNLAIERENIRSKTRLSSSRSSSIAKAVTTDNIKKSGFSEIFDQSDQWVLASTSLSGTDTLHLCANPLQSFTEFLYAHDSSCRTDMSTEYNV